VKDSAVELHHTTVANWNTQGLASGNYFLKLTVRNNFGDTVEAVRPIFLKTGATTGINSFAQQKRVSIYPNPTNGTFTIQLNDHENTSMEIYNVSGQKIITQVLQSNSAKIDLAGLAGGIYQIRLLKNNEVIYSGRMVKE
ncbi:MAG TPA: T9SS type A sorting domain-containing protein, partial [Bacteroidia bacterium]|nr:T9SS type A sorting domain-containing protein [Bacteroidia bacterium]